MPDKDYYAVLGVAPSATAEEIRHAYRRLSLEFHPDVSDYADATARFQEINEANEVLSHEAKRREYDRRHRRAANDAATAGRATPNGAGRGRAPSDNAGAGRTPPKGARAKPGMDNKGQTRQRPAGQNRRNQEYRRPADHASGGYEYQDESRPQWDVGNQRSQSQYEAQYEQEYRARVTGELIEWEREQRIAATNRIKDLRHQEEQARIARRHQEEQERQERWHQFEQELQQRRNQEDAERQERLSRLEMEIQRRRNQEEQEREERRITEERERQLRRTQEEQEREARLCQEV